MNELKTELEQFDSISLDKMENVSLLDRVEEKYVMSLSQLKEILPKLLNHYSILEVKSTRLNQYKTLYFDTTDFQMYLKHHNGMLNRFKIRSREYLDSDKSFFEIKFKNNLGKTIKKRIPSDSFVMNLNGEYADFVKKLSLFESTELEPKLYNSYSRFTLVNVKTKERVTFDLDLTFQRFDETKQLDFSQVVIAEIKQERFDARSYFIQTMHEFGIRSDSFSKYCVGVSLMYDSVKTNMFKEKRLMLEKIMRGESA